MGAQFAPKYTDEQKEACYLLYHVEHKKGPEAARILKRGSYRGLEPFEIPPDSLRKIAHTIRDRRETFGSKYGDYALPTAIEKVAKRAVLLADEELAKIEAAPKGKRALKRVADVIRVLERAQAVTKPQHAGAKPKPKEPKPTELGAKLSSGLNKGKRETVADPSPTTPTHNGDVSRLSPRLRSVPTNEQEGEVGAGRISIGLSESKPPSS